MTDPDVVIVGAGPAGLAAAAQLERFGVAAVVLEKAESVAQSWRERYDRLRLNTCRWTSTLPHSRYPLRAGLFPSRDEVVRYLENYFETNHLQIRFGARVHQIKRDGTRWTLNGSAGHITADQVIVATGLAHTPTLPHWPGTDRFTGRLTHAAVYRSPEAFRDLEVLVVGAGCSGLEIAYDLAEGGARRVQVAVRTQPNIMLRQSGIPGDLPAIALLQLPPGLADAPARLIRRLSIGDLSEYGLVPPVEGLFARHWREGKAPAIVDKEVIQAIRTRRIEIVPAVETLHDGGVDLVDGSRIAADAVIAATGYTTGLQPLVGHLGCPRRRRQATHPWGAGRRARAAVHRI